MPPARPLRSAYYPTVVGLLLTMVGLAMGCGQGVRQVQTGVPQPAPAFGLAPPDTGERAMLAVLFETGRSALPTDVKRLQFRVSALQLKATDGSWISYPADINSFDVTGGQRTRKRVLATRIELIAYDSLALLLSDVYVQYDANAGGPLTMPRDEPLRMALSFTPSSERPTLMRLIFEPGASVNRDDQGRWFFLPFVTATVE